MIGSMTGYCAGEEGVVGEFVADGLAMLSRRTPSRSRLLACLRRRVDTSTRV